MTEEPRHPMQPIVLDEHGTARFKANAIVRYLIDNGVIGLNHIARREEFTQNDREQFWQLLGYSVSGYGDLSFVSRDIIDEADALAEKLTQPSAADRPQRRNR